MYRMKRERSLRSQKQYMYFSNATFLISGFLMILLGALLLADDNRVLLSKLLSSDDTYLDKPIFQYVAYLIAIIGFLITITGLLGCWASCLFSCCFTTLYVALIVLLLFGELAACSFIFFWFEWLGIDVQPARLIRTLQRSYSVPGHEQFTAALDLAQTMFSCCGINGSSNYGTSWWRLQEAGRRDLVVPFTCCMLDNNQDKDAFLNPKPSNLTLCQSLNPAIHQYARHTTGCFGKIENWSYQQFIILLAIALGLLFIKVVALSSTIYGYRKKNKIKEEHTSVLTSTQTLHSFDESEVSFGSDENSMTKELSERDIFSYGKYERSIPNADRFNNSVLKRTTLYARYGDPEAVDALKNIYLNPLSRSRNNTVIIR